MKHVLPFVGLVWVLGASPLCAQVGNNNPAGQAGIFNGQVGACGYDPFTGNATRTITDIAVASSVGEYPLALVRTANSRAPSITGVFGTAGGWNHNYNWTMDDSPVAYSRNSLPTKYTVSFPDGRVETFRAVTWDSCYRVRPGNDTPQTTSAGIRERFFQLNPNNMYAYLILPDGGAIEFRAQQYNDPAYGRWWYTYHVTGIYDPYGLKTTIDSEVVGTIRRITRVTEPAGRYLQFTYDPNARRRITQITEYINGVARRSVQYYYTLGWLTSVVYYGNSAWTATYQYTGPNVPDLPMLLSTCDDPMYPGPMKRIAYQYKPGGPTDPNNPDGTRPVYGQILRERYWDGVSSPTSGPMVSELTIGESPNITYKRKETRGDGDSRTFIYGGSYVTWVPDFMGHSAQQHYDPTTKYVDFVVDRRGNRTDYTSDAITGNVTQIQLPLTNGDTTGQGNTRPVLIYSYTNSYYLHTIQDEAGNLTTIKRDPTHNRVTEIDYPDGGQETFSYDSNHLYEIQSHGMLAGGTESWTYDARHRNDTFRNPDNASGNPTDRYLYDIYDRVSDITDVLGTSAGDQNHTTSVDYNLRGQVTVTTLPKDPVDNVRHTIRNSYNDTGNNAGDGTLISVTDQLNHTTSYTYDNYRRLKSVTPPVRGSGDNGTYTTNFYYGANPWDAPVADYYLTDSKVTWIVPPSSSFRKVQIVYDDNRRTNSVTVAPGTLAEATTSYTYDNVGNVTWVTNPLNHNNVHTLYDERNRPYSISVGSHTSTIWYDTGGRTKEIDRPNGQVITNDNFDAMNRVTQRTATNTRAGLNQSIRTSYNYYPSGPANLLNTFQDPHLFGAGDQYTYGYDGIGRKRSLQYPLNGNGVRRTEQWSYDAVGRLGTFTNRDNPSKVQTFSYDALNRLTGFSWNDGGTTPSVSFGYDVASRLTSINNANASISRTYFNDNLLKSETETATGGVARAVNYTYDADGNRASLGIPGYTFNYDYTWRSQLQTVINSANNANIASYVYDLRGNVTSRTLNTNSTSSDFNYDAYDRVTSVNHNLSSGTRTIQYGYDDAHNSNNRLWAKRVINAQSPENNKGEVFSYDPTDQVTAFQLNVLNPNQVPPLSQTILYDPNGNRQFTPTAQYGAANNLSQYTTRTTAGVQTTANYDPKGNTSTGLDGSTYTYDAQNRLMQAYKNGATMTFKYDGLNRQVSRQLGTGTIYYSVWDGWNLVEDYHKSGNNTVVDASYVYGATGLVRDMENPNHYYYQDGSGSTSHLANNNGALVEWYRYDLDGNPTFYDGTDHVRNPNQSSFAVRHLFTGQQWYQELGLYDLRNRFYSPDLGRFLQPDPIGFQGGNNLYRYCGNNPLTKWDPFGLEAVQNLKSDPYSADPNYYHENPGDEWEIGGGTPEDPSNFGYDNNGNVDPGIVDSGPRALNPGGMGATVPGASFFGANSGSVGRPSEASGAGGFGPGNGGGNAPPNTPPAAAPVGMPMSQVITKMRKYRLPIDSKKIVAPVGYEFASYGLVPFANALDVGATMYVGGTVGGGVLGELAAPIFAAGPEALAESLQSAIFASRLTTAKILIGAQAATMGATSAAMHPTINREILDLLEEEMVPWEYWRP